MYDTALLDILVNYGLSESVVLMFFWVPILPLIPILILVYCKIIDKKKYINWLSLWATLYVMWVAVLLGFYWWIILLLGPILFVYFKVQTNLLMKAAEQSKEMRKRLFGK